MRVRLVLPLAVVLFAAVVVVARVRADGQTVQGQSTPSTPANVQVTTDRESYAPGDTVTVSVINLGPATIMPRGGRVCDSLWPIRLEKQDPNGWSSVPVP